MRTMSTPARFWTSESSALYQERWTSRTSSKWIRLCVQARQRNAHSGPGLMDLLFAGKLALAAPRFLTGRGLAFPLPTTEGVYFALFSVTPPGPSPTGPPSILIFSLI